MFAHTNEVVALRKFGTALCGVAILAVAGCGNVYVHEEFDKLTMNKSGTEVTSTIGKPAAVDAHDPAHVTWTYYGNTFDIDNQNKRDIKVVLTLAPNAAIHDLKVVNVQYQKG